MSAESRRTMVFLLDDEQSILSVLERFLIAEGFRVFSSTQWSEVGQRLVAHKASAVLVCDLNLPGIRGEEFCRTVLSYRTNVAVVIYSGVDRGVAAAACKRLGPRARFVEKLDGMEKLLSGIEAAAAWIERPPPPPERSVFLVGTSLHRPIEVAEVPITVGRAPDRTIILPWASISRCHATLRANGGAVALTDHATRNGTLVDGEPIRGTVSITRDAVIGIGPFQLGLRFGITPEEATKASIELFERSSSIGVPAAAIGSILLFASSAGIEGRMAFQPQPSDRTAEAGVISLRGATLVSASFGDLRGAKAAEWLFQNATGIVSFSKGSVGDAQPSAPNLLELFERVRRSPAQPRAREHDPLGATTVDDCDEQPGRGR